MVALYVLQRGYTLGTRFFRIILNDVLGLDHSSSTGERPSRERILEFSYISRPRSSHQLDHGVLTHLDRSDSDSPTDTLQESGDEPGNVFSSLRQSREPNGYLCQTIVEIASECAVYHPAFEVPVRRSDQAQIGPD